VRGSVSGNFQNIAKCRIVVERSKASREACRETSRKAFRKGSLAVVDVLHALDTLGIEKKKKKKKKGRKEGDTGTIYVNRRQESQ
jgi:hypothetical protein